MFETCHIRNHLSLNALTAGLEQMIDGSMDHATGSVFLALLLSHQVTQQGQVNH